jgi:hypothetical protein
LTNFGEKGWGQVSPPPPLILCKLVISGRKFFGYLGHGPMLGSI